MTPEETYFLTYQDSWIDDESTLKIAEKSRRCGFTFASSYRIFQKCMKRGNGFIQWVSSRDQLTAQEFIRDYIAKWCKLANVVAFGMTGVETELIDPTKNIRAFVVVFPNGARIYSLSSSPEAFAGKGGDVFLDEVDLHLDSGKLVDMALPCITWGGQLEMVSAYRVDGSKDTPFAKMVTLAKTKENPQGASLHRVTILDAVDQGLVEKINETTGKPVTREAFLKRLRALCRTQAAWDSQYLCITQDAGGKLLTTAAITACEMDPDELQAVIHKYPTAQRYAGYDVARTTHGAAWHEYVLIGTSLFLAVREVTHDEEFDVQENRIRARMTDKHAPRITRMAIDSTGLGMMMAERLVKAFPGRVDAVNLESSRRHELCMMFKDRIDNRRIFIPDDDQLRADFSSPVLDKAANGALRIVIPAFQGADGNITHSDEFMAAVLANSAADAGTVPACQTVNALGHTTGGSRSRRSFL